MTAGFNTNLLTNLATYLQTNNLGTWNTSGAYSSSQTGITLYTMPQGVTDKIICLSAYGVADEPLTNHSIIGVQIRCRMNGANPTLVDDLADSIFVLIQGKTNWTLGAGATATSVVLCERSSFVSLGQDTNGRWSNSSNYYFTVCYPGANRL
jgi:hypothetical protein